jgi:hypothetical protein
MTWNAIDSPYQAPHVYVIFAIDVVYIGETQKHPAIRWAQHLEGSDGLRSRLAEKGDPELDYMSNLVMFAKRCDWIKHRFAAAQWKTVTQAVEHALHESFAADPGVLGGYRRLISDTEKTAPRSFRYWDLVNEFAQEIIGDLRALLHRPPSLPAEAPVNGEAQV